MLYYYILFTYLLCLDQTYLKQNAPCRMRYLAFSVLVILAIGLFAAPGAFADHDSDEQWGTLYVEKPVLELPYSAWDNHEYKKIKIFGTVEDPRSATWVYFTITEPDGKTVQVKVIASDDGNYENFILICCNDIGQYSVYAEWRGYHIGTVTFEVVENLAEITEGTETVTEESIQKIPSWVREIFIWYAAEQITEADLLGAIQFLVQQGIIELE